MRVTDRAYSFRRRRFRLARVSEDEIALQLGQKRSNVRVTSGYGEWDPSYLANAAKSLDAWLLQLQRLIDEPLFSHGIPTTVRGRRTRAA